MPQSDGLPSTQAETPTECREMAQRARRLARDTLDPDAGRNLREFAGELEARARALEDSAGTSDG